MPDRRFCYREGVERLRTAKAVLGLIFERTGAAPVTPALLLLATPSAEGGDAILHVHDLDGALVYGGRIRIEGGSAYLSFGTLGLGARDPGAPPLEVEGELSEDGFRVQRAWSAVVTTPAQARIVATPSGATLD